MKRFSIDIICPVYNGGILFVQTLESLSGVKIKDNIRLIVSDNHSTDDRAWLGKFKDLRDQGWDAEIMSPPSRLGRTEHWSWALTQGSHEWIKPLFVGDVLMTDYFDAFGRILQTESIALASGQHVIMLPDKTAVPAESRSTSVYRREDFLKTNLKQGNILGPPSAAIFRRQAMTAALPFDENFPWAADWLLYLRASKYGHIAHIQRNVMSFNQNSTRYSTSPRVIWKSLIEEWKVRTLIARELSSPLRGFASNLRHTSHNMVMKYGRAFFPRFIRKPLGYLYRTLKNKKP